MIFELGMLSRLSRMASRKCSSGDATRSEMGMFLRLADSQFRIAAGALHGQRSAEIRERHGRQPQRRDEGAVLEAGDADGDRVRHATRGTIAVTPEFRELAGVGVLG